MFLGIQPTGNIDIGNYLGAIRPWVASQAIFDNIFGIVEYFIDSLDLRPGIDEYVSADEVDRCKPRPDIFELALQRADVEPEEAVAIDDLRELLKKYDQSLLARS